MQKPNGKIIFDFHNPEALRCLTLTLLKKDFDLELIIPENKLIPTLPLRLNYILWIEDLLEWTAERQFSLSGVDIGKNFIDLLILFSSGFISGCFHTLLLSSQDFFNCITERCHSKIFYCLK